MPPDQLLYALLLGTVIDATWHWLLGRLRRGPTGAGLVQATGAHVLSDRPLDVRWMRSGMACRIEILGDRTEFKAVAPGGRAGKTIVLTSEPLEQTTELRVTLPRELHGIRIRHTDESVARDFLSERVVASLRRLPAVAYDGRFSVEIGDRAVTVRKFSALDDDDLPIFARLCLPIAEQAMRLRKETGVEIVGPGTVCMGECQVCGLPLHESVVTCALCRTPHHRECWQYVGRCSTYACGSRRAA